MTPEMDQVSEDDVSLSPSTPTPATKDVSKQHNHGTQDGPAECVNKRMPFANGLGTDMVDLYVGSDEELFRVHKQKLCRRIPYFDKMFNGHFKEASENIARFPEDNPAAFDVLVEWVYSRTGGHIRPLAASEGENHCAWDGVEVYSLAEKFCLPDLQDTIMSVIIKRHKLAGTLPSTDFVKRAYLRTSSGSKLSQYCARSIQYVLGTPEVLNGCPTGELEQLFSDSPNLIANYISLQRDVAVTDPRTIDRCVFHLHGPGNRCNDGGGKKRKRLEVEDVE